MLLQAATGGGGGEGGARSKRPISLGAMRVGPMGATITFLPAAKGEGGAGSMLSGLRGRSGVAGFVARKINMRLEKGKLTLPPLLREGEAFYCSGSLADDLKRHYVKQGKEQVR